MASTLEPLVPSEQGDPSDAALLSEETVEEPTTSRRRFLLFHAVPAWMISTLMHVVLLLALGLVTLADPVEVVNVLSAVTTSEEGPEIEEFTIEEVEPGAMSEMEELSEPIADVSEPMEMLEPTPVEVPLEEVAVPLEMAELAEQLAPSSSTLQSLASMSASGVGSRSGDMKKKLLRDYGGNASSEAAVTESLKWLSRHQMPNGAWTFHHHLVCNGRCGNPGDAKRATTFGAATAMALLPFLGAGQTHYDGQFQEVVRRGLLFLIQNAKAGQENGLAILDCRIGGDMYSHGLVAIALCEAYAMTEDPALAAPAQRALNYISVAQAGDGGWGYAPTNPGFSDTSVTGWQVMALKSGHMGHLAVLPQTIKGSSLFLDRVASDGGSMYGYRSPLTGKETRPGCTAIGLLCRMYTGWSKTHPAIAKGVDYLAKVGVNKTDIYYDYYAAQVLRHHGGAAWDEFNVELRDWLVESQAQDGGAKGSWFFPNSKSHRGPHEGGRLASTSFATMILEVYYRHMPLYADTAAEEDFPL